MDASGLQRKTEKSNRMKTRVVCVVQKGFCLNHVLPLCKAFVVYSTYTDNEYATETKVPN